MNVIDCIRTYGLKPHYKYAWHLAKHKWNVLVQARKLGITSRGITHDHTKFTWWQWWTYALSFNGPWSYRDRPEWLVRAFDGAWHRHQKSHDHHWQYWVASDFYTGQCPGPYSIGIYHQLLFEDSGKIICLGCRREFQRDDPDLWVNAVPMSDSARREMLADWLAFPKGDKVKAREWYTKSKTGRILHPETREWIEQQLGFTDT